MAKVRPINLHSRLAPYFLPTILGIGFLFALALRMIIGGTGVAYSIPAGLVFAAVLWSLSLAGGLSWNVTGKTFLFGAFGAFLLLMVPLVQKIFGGAPDFPAGNYLSWSLTIVCVASAEEAFLRGTLYDYLVLWRGDSVAILVAAIFFALLHVPLYGWHVIPLDFLVGLWLGELRRMSGSWLAPGLAHALADLCSWWLI